MAATTDTFSAWLGQARIPEHRLTPDQRGALRAELRELAGGAQEHGEFVASRHGPQRRTDHPAENRSASSKSRP